MQSAHLRASHPNFRQLSVAVGLLIARNTADATPLVDLLPDATAADTSAASKGYCLKLL
jgi:hypothetical protein